MKKTFKVIAKIFFVLLISLVLFVVISKVNHSYQFNKERELRKPIGQLVKVDGKNMHVLIQGAGEKTLVIMSGGGTCSPSLDFKSLYSLLQDKYRIIVVEKFGYGFSDVTDDARDIETILSQTRKALQAVGVKGQYILVPHSMSGLEALYWAQKYPNEVQAIIGLDMAVPRAYKNYSVNRSMIKILSFANNWGVTRWFPSISEGASVKYGMLTSREKEIYKALFYDKTLSKNMIGEIEEIKVNAGLVAQKDLPNVPYLLFSSNGEGTGWDETKWRSLQREFVASVAKGELVELDCPHYIHDFKYEEIAEIIKSYLDS